MTTGTSTETYAGESRERATVPLLDLVARGAVDADYAFVAGRRIQAGSPASRPGRHVLASAGIVVFGLLIAVAAVQTSRNASVDSASRTLLITQVDQRRATLADQQTQLRDLRRGNAGLASERRRLDGTLSGVQAAVAVQRRATGFSDLDGPGLQVTVDDNPDGDADGRVRATDLRLLVNALWQSGAEGVEINGRRLTAVSSIVNANIAIQVDRGPVSPPYVVTAVGPLATLPGALSATATGQQFAALADQFGFGVVPRTLTEVALAAAPTSQLSLRQARPVTTDSGDQGGGS